jgi:serine palmitoyltransferase
MAGTRWDGQAPGWPLSCNEILPGRNITYNEQHLLREDLLRIAKIRRQCHLSVSGCAARLLMPPRRRQVRVSVAAKRRARSKSPCPRKNVEDASRRAWIDTGVPDESRYVGGNHNPITLFAAVTTYFGFALLFIFGRLRDFVGTITGHTNNVELREKRCKDLAPLVSKNDLFYTRRMYNRIVDVFNRPIVGPPGAHIDVLERERSADGTRMVLKTGSDTGKTSRCTNLGSYNYLGFADDWASTCKDDVFEAVEDFSTGACGPRVEAGTTSVHKELEEMVARFVGKEAAFVFNMGYGTNSTGIPALMGKGSLIISDSLNHTSIVNGARASGAKIMVFRHNDAQNLESVLREAVVDGQPRTHRPWKKILVMVEGIYSMEGEVCNLREIVRISKKYKAYLYVDEAHSIGAAGATGRGICEYWGVDPADVDILMGTFSKSFGGMGGYIASSKAFCDMLRVRTSGSLVSNSLSPVVCQQVLTAFKIITGEDGTDLGKQKLRAVKENADYFRAKLKSFGCEVFGDSGSPVVPMMLYNPSKIGAFSRECLERGLATVSVGFPAVPLTLGRARFCISAAHTRADLDDALKKIEEVAKKCNCRYKTHVMG